MGCTSHGMSGLAAAGGACPWQVFRSVAPCNIAFFPRHTEKLSHHAMHVGPGFGAEIADPGLDINAAIGLDDEETVEAHRPAGVAADRCADTSHFRAIALAGFHFPLIPLELLGATVQRFLDECAGGILLFPIHKRTERGLSFGAVDA